MPSYAAFAVLGLGSGAIYAVVAMGIVVQQRGSNILNFAFAAMMMISTLVYTSIRSAGSIDLPIPGLPAVNLSGGQGSAWLAALLAVAVVVGIAALAHFLIFRWIRGAPALSRVAAAVGLMLTLEAVATIRYGALGGAPTGVLPGTVVTVFGARLQEFELLLPVIAILIGLAFWALFRFTGVGLAIRASAESEMGAAILGWSPDRLALFTWIVAGLLAGVTGVLIAPIAATNQVTYALLIIPALGVALVAQFRSFAVCVVGGLSLGILGSVLQRAGANFAWLPQSGVQDGVAFVFILMIMVLAGQHLPTRGTPPSLRQPIAYAPRHVLRRTIALTLVAVILIFATSGGARFAVIDSLIGIVLALSLVVVTGYAGQISLCQFTFAGLAGFILSKLGTNLGIPFPLAPLLACMCAAAFGVVIGLPALRVRGINLAIVTLAAAQAIDSLLFQNPSFSGGYSGAPIAQPRLFGWDLSISAGGGQASIAFAVMCLIVAVIACLAVANLRRSATGRRMLAVRANEKAAAASGINVSRVKLLSFTISAFIAGIGGCLFAYEQLGGNLSTDSFGPIASLTLLAAVFIGGVSTVSGAIIAGLASGSGVLYFLLSSNISSFTQWQALVGGLGLIVVAVRQPDGVAGFNIKLFRERVSPFFAKRKTLGPTNTTGMSKGANSVLIGTPKSDVLERSN
jgi:ABC-type branched-subunit amino acid transport system permease subunit